MVAIGAAGHAAVFPGRHARRCSKARGASRCGADAERSRCRCRRRHAARCGACRGHGRAAGGRGAAFGNRRLLPKSPRQLPRTRPRLRLRRPRNPQARSRKRRRKRTRSPAPRLAARPASSRSRSRSAAPADQTEGGALANDAAQRDKRAPASATPPLRRAIPKGDGATHGTRRQIAARRCESIARRHAGPWRRPAARARASLRHRHRSRPPASKRHPPRYRWRWRRLPGSPPHRCCRLAGTAGVDNGGAADARSTPAAAGPRNAAAVDSRGSRGDQGRPGGARVAAAGRARRRCPAPETVGVGKRETRGSGIAHLALPACTANAGAHRGTAPAGFGTA